MNDEQTPKISPDGQGSSPKITFKQKPIRTYESDIAEALANRKASVATIAIAESQKKEGVQRIVNTAPAQEKEERTNWWPIVKHFFFLLLSIVLITGGIGGGYYLYLQSPIANPVPEAPVVIKVPSVIDSDKQVTFNLDGIPRDNIINQINFEANKSPLPKGQILEMLLKEKKGGEDVTISGAGFLNKIGISIPDVLLRSIKDRWMFGIYTEKDSQRTPFVVLTTDFFQNTFAGMLAWEKTMPDDLSELFRYKDRVREADNASSTISSYFGITGDFIDRQLRNRDIREFRDRRGNLLFLYAFIDEKTLMITSTESAFMDIIDRIEKQNYIR